MNAIEQQNAPCSRCGRVTIHSRNVERTNWLLHIVLALVTGGLWLFVALLIAMSNASNKGSWVCSTCGTYLPTAPPRPFFPKFETTEQKVGIGLLAGFVIFALFSLSHFSNYSNPPSREDELAPSEWEQSRRRVAAEQQRSSAADEAQSRRRREQAEERIAEAEKRKADRQKAIDEAVRKFHEEQAAKAKE